MKRYITIILIVILSITSITLGVLLFNSSKKSNNYSIWIANKGDKIQLIDKVDKDGNTIEKENSDIPLYLLTFENSEFIFIKEGILYKGKYNYDNEVIIFDGDDDNIFFACKYKDDELTECDSVANRFKRL